MGSSEARFPIKIVLKINGGLGLRDFTLSPSGSNPVTPAGAGQASHLCCICPKSLRLSSGVKGGSFQPHFLERAAQVKVKAMGGTASSFRPLSPPLSCLPFPRPPHCLFTIPLPGQTQKAPVVVTTALIIWQESAGALANLHVIEKSPPLQFDWSSVMSVAIRSRWWQAFCGQMFTSVKSEMVECCAQGVGLESWTCHTLVGWLPQSCMWRTLPS